MNEVSDKCIRGALTLSVIGAKNGGMDTQRICFFYDLLEGKRSAWQKTKAGITFEEGGPLSIVMSAAEQRAVATHLLHQQISQKSLPGVQIILAQNPDFLFCADQLRKCWGTIAFQGESWTPMTMTVETALTLASANRVPEIVEALLRAGAPVNASTQDKGETPLMMAVTRDDIQTAQLLMAYGADIHALDGQKRTALHISAMWGSQKTCALLLGAEMDPETLPRAVQLAHKYGNRQIESLIQMHTTANAARDALACLSRPERSFSQQSAW